MKHDSQFGPHRLVFRQLGEEFWLYNFSFDQCMLAILKNLNIKPNILYYAMFQYVPCMNVYVCVR